MATAQGHGHHATRATKAPTKQATTIRLSPDVMAAFKATGAGLQTRIDAALNDWLHTP